MWQLEHWTKMKQGTGSRVDKVRIWYEYGGEVLIRINRSERSSECGDMGGGGGRKKRN
jgi:hypothetical protein